MSNLDLYVPFGHTIRSFDCNVAVDSTTIAELEAIADSFVAVTPNTAKFLTTDINLTNQLYENGLDESEVSEGIMVKATQLKAPLVISVYSNTHDRITMFKIGSVMAKLGLKARERGYQTGFATRLYYKNLRALLGSTVFPFDRNIHMFLSVGMPLFPEQPHNYRFDLLENNPSCFRKEQSKYITVIDNTGV